MAGFDKDDFWRKILSMYEVAEENDFVLKLEQDQIQELKALFLEVYVPMSKLRFYNDERIMREMMRTIVSIYKLDKDFIANYGEIVELVNSVQYDGRNLYLHYSKISPIKFRRFELGKTRKQIAEAMGYGSSTVKNCENYWCDLTRQPMNLRSKLAKALEWSIEEFNEHCRILE